MDKAYQICFSSDDNELTDNDSSDGEEAPYYENGTKSKIKLVDKMVESDEDTIPLTKKLKS